MVSIEGAVDVRQPSPSLPTFCAEIIFAADEADRSDFHGQSRQHEMQSGCSKHIGGYFFTL
jgi:hypothetical protein